VVGVGEERESQAVFRVEGPLLRGLVGADADGREAGLREIPAGVELAILLEEYGATASILADLIAENRIPVTESVATALAYGIKADTQDLGRETSEGDIRAYTYIYALANKRILSRIETARVPRNYFREFGKAIENAVLYDIAVLSDLGEMEVADMAAEMADFLLRLEGIRWSFVMGHCGDTLHLSLRASDEQLNSGEVIAQAVGERGSCGGHAAMAGGFCQGVEFLPHNLRSKGIGVFKTNQIFYVFLPCVLAG